MTIQVLTNNNEVRNLTFGQRNLDYRRTLQNQNQPKARYRFSHGRFEFSARNISLRTISCFNKNER